MVLLWFNWQSGLVVAQTTDEFLIKNWTTSDGLPENTVRTIIETRDGYLWLGTANGLARFDGVRFTRFNSVNTPTLINDDISSLHEDSSGAIWISTRRGVLRFRNGNYETMTLHSGGPPALLGNFAEDTSGRLWMQGVDGFVQWDGKALIPVSLPDEGPRSVRHICAAPDGGLWVAANNGLWRYRNAQFERFAVAPFPQLIAAGRDGRLWGLVDEQRLYVLDAGSWKEAADLAEERCRTLYVTREGDVWVGAASRNRAFRLRHGQITEINEANGLDGNRTICFAEDREGNLWLGMNGAGIYRLSERRLTVYNRSKGLRALSLASVCEDDEGNMLVSVMGWGLHRFGRNAFEPLVLASGEGFESSTALAPARAGGVWAGTYGGQLCRVDQGRIVERIGSDTGTRALFTDRAGNLWRGTRSAGIEHFVGTNVTRYATKEGLSFDNVYCITQDKSGAIWVGTEDGLNQIVAGRINRFGMEQGLGHHFISALCADSEGLVWVGTLGGGLSAWTGSRFVTLSIHEGLPDNTITQLIEDGEQHLWIGTRAGLMRVALSQLRRFLSGDLAMITGKLVGFNDGLSRPDTWTEYQPAGIKARDGRLWFCTSSGLAVMDPKRFESQMPPPLVHIEEVTLDGAVLKAGDPVQIPPGNQRLEIHYTGISLSGPELVRFRYRLKGYDRDWVAAGNSHMAYYSHVRPGRYEFEVRAANNDGVWSTGGGRVILVFEPSYYQTIWFRALLVTLFAGLGPIFHFWRVRRSERRRTAQEAFSRQLIDSQERERSRIAAELHDSLGQNLLVIKNRADLALAQKVQPEKLETHLNEISTMASTAIREVREIAQNLRPFQLDELGLTQAITAMTRQLSQSTNIGFRVDLENLDHALPSEFEISFYRVIQECLSNIVKHSGAASATITGRREPRAIRVVVVDNGRGFVVSTVDNGTGLGLRNLTERIRTMGGMVSLHSLPGHGTQIEILVPTASVPAIDSRQRA